MGILQKGRGACAAIGRRGTANGKRITYNGNWDLRTGKQGDSATGERGTHKSSFAVQLCPQHFPYLSSVFALHLESMMSIANALRAGIRANSSYARGAKAKHVVLGMYNNPYPHP